MEEKETEKGKGEQTGTCDQCGAASPLTHFNETEPPTDQVAGRLISLHCQEGTSFFRQAEPTIICQLWIYTIGRSCLVPEFLPTRHLPFSVCHRSRRTR